MERFEEIITADVFTALEQGKVVQTRSDLSPEWSEVVLLGNKGPSSVLPGTAPMIRHKDGRVMTNESGREWRVIVGVQQCLHGKRQYGVSGKVVDCPLIEEASALAHEHGQMLQNVVMEDEVDQDPDVFEPPVKLRRLGELITDVREMYLALGSGKKLQHTSWDDDYVSIENNRVLMNGKDEFIDILEVYDNDGEPDCAWWVVDTRPLYQWLSHDDYPPQARDVAIVQDPQGEFLCAYRCESWIYRDYQGSRFQVNRPIAYYLVDGVAAP